MEAKDIPAECLNNIQFSKVLKATLETEIKSKRARIKDVQEQIEIVKKSLETKYNERKKMKQILEVEKEKKDILEPTLKVLTASYEGKSLELKLLESDLDSDSLRIKDNQRKYIEILDNYKTTWEEYQGEYEKSKLAIKRKESKNEVEKAKVEFMILQYKKAELIRMSKQKKEINEKRSKAMIIVMSKLVLERWAEQRYQEQLKMKVENMRKEFKDIYEKHKKLQQEAEDDAKAKALARQLMPAPRLDNTLLRSLYTPVRQTQKEASIHRAPSIDPDTMSVNSAIFEQLCSGNEKALDSLNNSRDEEYEEEETERSTNFYRSSQCSVPAEESTKNSKHDAHLEGLENVCRQLSIDDASTCDDCHNEMQNMEPNRITCEAIIEAPRMPENQQSSIDPPSNSLKKKISLNRLSMEAILGEPEKKKSKLSDIQENQLTPKLSDLKKIGKESPAKGTPKIKKVETIHKPIKMQLKPPMAEVPPTPSNLLPTRHYAASCASSDISMMGEGNYHEANTNWQHLSSPRQVESAFSFMSDASMFKNLIRDGPAMSTSNSGIEANPLKSESQSNNPPSNFLNFFGTSKSNTQAFF